MKKFCLAIVEDNHVLDMLVDLPVEGLVPEDAKEATDVAIDELFADMEGESDE